jgi:hypothetical protein
MEIRLQETQRRMQAAADKRSTVRWSHRGLVRGSYAITIWRLSSVGHLPTPNLPACCVHEQEIAEELKSLQAAMHDAHASAEAEREVCARLRLQASVGWRTQ